MVDDIEFKDESEYGSEEKISMKQIILRHIRKISDLCCKEFTGGYWEKKPMKTGSGIFFSETYHEDIREAYCNAVDFLIDVIYPFGDSDLKKYLDANEKIEKDWKDDIKGRLIQKKKTFREINFMFERTNFWQGSESYSE